jgi:hypothetical protein
LFNLQRYEQKKQNTIFPQIISCKIIQPFIKAPGNMSETRSNMGPGNVLDIRHFQTFEISAQLIPGASFLNNEPFK